MSPGKLLRPMAGPCAYSLSSTPLAKPMPHLIDDLLRRMSLVEKVCQLNRANPDTDSTGAAIAATDIESRIRRGEIGGLAGGAGQTRPAAFDTDIADELR